MEKSGRIRDVSRGAAFEEIFGEGKKAGETEGWVDVMFDDVEGEIVGAAKAPDGEGDEDGGLEGEVLEEEKSDAGGADDEEEKRFEVNGRFAL
jgi:hypothetical protein